MGENMSHFLSLIGSVFLFVFALSCAIFAYEGLEDRLENFFKMNSITARREDATSHLVDLSTIEREVGFEEIFMAIMDLPRYATFDIIYSDDSVDFQATGDLDKRIQIGNDTSFFVLGDFDSVNYTITTYICVEESGIIKKYNINSKDDFDDLVEEIVFVALGKAVAISGNSSNIVLDSIETDIENITFSMSYDEDTIVYKRNT